MKEVSKRLKFVEKYFRKSNTAVIVLVFEIVISLAILWIVRTEIVTAFKGTEAHGSFMNLDFMKKFLVSIGVMMIITSVLLFNQLKEKNLNSKFFVFVLLILLPFIFNNIVFAGWILGFILLEKMNFNMYIFDVYLINFLIFSSGLLFIVNRIIKMIKKDEDVVKGIESIVAGSMRNLVYLVTPVTVILASVVLVESFEKRYDFLLLAMGVGFAWCSSALFVIQQVKVLKKLLKQ